MRRGRPGGEQAHAAGLGEVKAGIEIKGLGCSFGAQKVLSDISFSVRGGEVLGIVGPGGVGKTVLLKMIAGLLKPTAGEVLIDGSNLFDLVGIDRFHVRRRMGMLFQNAALFDFLDVSANVAFPLLQGGDIPAKQAERLAQAALSSVGLNGTDHMETRELSGGMKKRVALARATIHEPDIVLYDDPTAGLDPVTSSKIFDLMRRLHDARDSTDLVVSHDLDRLTRICDRYLLLFEGKVHFLGTMKEARIQHDDRLIDAFFFGASGSGLLDSLRRDGTEQGDPGSDC